MLSSGIYGWMNMDELLLVLDAIEYARMEWYGECVMNNSLGLSVMVDITAGEPVI
jgi:hypothetical protein